MAAVTVSARAGQPPARIRQLAATVATIGGLMFIIFMARREQTQKPGMLVAIVAGGYGKKSRIKRAVETVVNASPYDS